MKFFANYFYNTGLAKTSVSSSSILCNTSSIFVYLFSLFFLKDAKFEYIKAGTVLCSFLGIIIVTYSDHS